MVCSCEIFASFPDHCLASLLDHFCVVRSFLSSSSFIVITVLEEVAVFVDLVDLAVLALTHVALHVLALLRLSDMFNQVSDGGLGRK